MTTNGHGAILIGAAGVGKTTLARVVTESLGSPVQWIAGTESARSIPLGAFAPFIGPSGAHDAVTLVASARESLLAKGTVVLGVDDAHLLDQLSATLLQQLAIDRAVRIIATIRTGEPVPDAVTALWKNEYLDRIELRPFTKEESIRLVQSVLDGQLEDLSADVMWDMSGGNALFLRHLVEGALDTGHLIQVAGVWQLRGQTTATPGLTQLLEHRLDRAGREAQSALGPLALCEPLDIDILCHLAGEEAVDTAELRGLIRIEPAGSRLDARFCHPLLGDVVRGRLGTASARKLRGRLVDELQQRGAATAAERIRLAELYIDSDCPPDTELLVTAAKDAISLSNLPLGERIARRAVERGGGVAAAELLARALLWQGHPALAERTLAAFDPDDLNELELVQWGIPHVSILFWSLGDVQHAHEILGLLRERTHHPALQLLAEAVASAIAVHENRLDEGLTLAERVLSNPDSPSQAIEWAAFSTGLGAPLAGRGNAFEAIAARCRNSRKSTDGMIRAMIRYGEVRALTQVGNLTLAERRVAEYSNFSSAGQFLAWAISKIMAAMVDTSRGCFPDVISEVEQALAAFRAEVPLPWRLPATILLAKAYAALGQPERARIVLNAAHEHTGEHMALHRPSRLIAQSWLAAAENSARRSVELANLAAEAAHASGQYAIEADALHDAARFGDRTVADRLAQLVERVDGPIVSILARHAAAAAAADAACLDTISDDFERHGLLLHAADAAALAAAAHTHDGSRRKSTESGARAFSLAARCGGVTTPAIQVAAHPLPLTVREREIAMLVAAGLTNKQIAERLVVSVRTVEGHIYRACIKLDVTDRDQLGRLMRDE
ncbi:Response regulator receiver protein [Rhodococcus sp. RD6.2]|uniref:helix-turn-helix transcriptional regulator n=1 Tax=Rhodococcus sp. RD6.2 TaxID=260936 RepID=UPI00063B4270|nr:helix-turn-helix transcriptional regulator [Rhodococcus sp. RD6.2]CRK49985.1 Response regulator receiver protein [Rhodococcus sp. RD6.2]